MAWSYRSQDEADMLATIDQAPIVLLPTTDPEVVGALWNNNGVLEISGGPVDV